MGKNKQRTKNNTQPSSSQRSAELLNSSSLNLVGFLSFAESTNHLKDLDMNHVDPNIQMVFRKMNKKDSTTKYKALQEFADLCRNVELSSIEACLPFWPRLYCNLTIDTEHRVREAVQVTHAALVKKLGKKIAIYLKQLSGPWFIAQFDPYPPASSAAQNSFSDTFPANKIVSAVIHCQEDILDYIYNNIMVHTPQSLSANKSLTPEEMEAKYQRVVISSLQAYGSYFKTVPGEEVEKMRETHMKIVKDGKFWKFSKHKEVAIKTAFYQALSSIIANATELLADDKKRTMSSVVNSIDEVDPCLVAAVWETFLVAWQKIEDWHAMISIEKALLPKLWRILKLGGQSCATIIYPNLLPLFNQLSKLNLEKKAVFGRLFESWREGLQLKQNWSRSESIAIVTTFFECFRYIVLLNVDDVEMCQLLIEQQLVPVIKHSLSESCQQRHLYHSELAQLVRFWSENRDSYSSFMTFFWSKLRVLLETLQQDAKSSPVQLQNSCSLLLALKNPTLTLRKKTARVTFSDVAEHCKLDSQVSVKIMDVDKTFVDGLDEVISSFCAPFLDEVNTSPNKNSFENVIQLARNFSGPVFFQQLAKSHNGTDDLLAFYTDKVEKWMINNEGDVENVMPLVFNIIEFVDGEKKKTILESLLKLKHEELLIALKCALTCDIRNDEHIKTWSKNTKITVALQNVAKNLVAIRENYASKVSVDQTTGQEASVLSQKRDMILLVFLASKEQDLSVDDDAINGISSILCKALQSARQEELNRESDDGQSKSPINEEILNFGSMYLTKLISELLKMTFNYKKVLPGTLEMLETLLRLNIENESTEDDVCEVWKIGYSKILSQTSNSFFVDLVRRISPVIWKKLFEPNSSIVKTVLQRVQDFVKIFVESEETWTELVLEFLLNVDIEQWMTQTYGLVMSMEVVSGKLHPPTLRFSKKIWGADHEFNLETDTYIDCMGKCAKWAEISMDVLGELVDDFEADSMKFENILENVVHIRHLGKKYQKCLQWTKFYGKVKTSLSLLGTKLDTSEILKETESKYSARFYETWNFDQVVFADKDVNSLISIYNEASENQIDIFFDLFNRLIQRQVSEPGIFCYDCDVDAASWEQLALPIAMMHTLTNCLHENPRFSTDQWDFIMVSLATWQLSVNKSTIKYDSNFKNICFVVSVTKLYRAVRALMKKHEEEALVSELPPNLLDEWKKVFVDDVHAGIANTWATYSDLYNHENPPLVAIFVINELGKSMQMIDGEVFDKKTTIVTPTVSEMIQICLKFMRSPIISIQLGAFHTLRRLIPQFVKSDMSKIEVENFNPKTLFIWEFEETLNASLEDFKEWNTISDSCELFEDACTRTLGDLLTFSIVLEMCGNAGGDLRYHYSEMMKTDIFPKLLENIFPLFPIQGYEAMKNKYPQVSEQFTTDPSLSFDENWTPQCLQHIACWLFVNCLRFLPVLVRQWWSTCDSKVSAAVERITSLYISPMLCQEELTNQKLNVENMTIKVYPTAREVVALYQMDDTKLELSIVLPANHPLGSVVVTPGQHVKGTGNWANWHMQHSVFLTHQNGSIWDGLMLWKKNLDKRFCGVEECYICFSIFHVNTYQIPKLSCRTCRKKFHNTCLYKWFNTSQKSTCPICRNIF